MPGKFDDLQFKFKEIADERVVDALSKMGNALAMIYKRIPGTVVLPRIFQITGKVKAEITNTPKVITDNKDVIQALKAIEMRMGAMATAISMIAVQKPQVYPEIKIPKVDFDDVIEAIHGIEPGGSGSNEDIVNGLDRVYEAVATLANRPSMTTAPATHMSINSLNGAIKTTDSQVGSTITPMPGVPLVNRRSWQIYNNGSSTIYFGGANVSSTNGIPVTSGSYSDIIDAGQYMNIYVICASGQNSDCRLLEISDANSGS